MVLQGADNLQPGAVPHMRQAGVPVPAEIPLADQPVPGAVEDRPPFLQLAHAVGRFPGVQLGHAPLVEKLAATHGVTEVDLPAVAAIDVAQCRRHSPFGHHRVSLSQKRFAHETGAHAAGGALDGRTQPGPARADHQHVVLERLEVGHVEHP